MISRWRAARTSSSALMLALVVMCAADAGAAASDSTAAGVRRIETLPISAVRFTGARAVSASALERDSVLKKGLVYSDSLLASELARVDSVYFAAGRLGVAVEVDTVRAGDGVAVRFAISEGEIASVGAITVSGSGLLDESKVKKRVRPVGGEPFDPIALERSLESLLDYYIESGYPFAQVWLTGFTYRREANEVDIALSLFEGERSRIGRVAFEGRAKTDSTLATRTTRLRPGELFKESDLAGAKRYLGAAGYFESVGDPRVEHRPGGLVDVVIPVMEISRGNLFQGALGFSKKSEGSYILNGSVDLELKNIAGTGRNARFDWLNDGRTYSRLGLKFREPFLLSTPLGLDAEISQIVEDSSYTWHSGGVYVSVPLGPRFSIVIGAAADRNVPDFGELLRSVRQRYRIGVAGEAASAVSVDCYAEGAYKSNYLRGNRSEADRQILAHVDARLVFDVFGEQSVFARLVSDAVFSSGEIPLAETFPLGGARTLRGYREGQFRAEKLAYANLEYRFGEGGWFFLFDDVGAFQRRPAGWTVKNGAGFGVRSESSLGAVALSFGVGEELSLEGTRIHISLEERF